MVEETPTQPVTASTKEEILRRVRDALGVRKQDRQSDYAYIPRQYVMSGSLGEDERLDLFIDRLRDYGASVYECDEASIPVATEKALQKRGLKRLLTGREFPPSWIPTGYPFGADETLDYQRIDKFEGVMTPCAIAIAETGTIVLRHADDEPRRAVSLIPDYHLCVVFAEQVVQTVVEGVRQMGSMGNVPLTTIAGPSATSDIEMTRIKGVHGPRTLDVILVRGE